MRAILIDVNRQEVRAISIIGDLHGIQHAINDTGCYIELALRLPRNHVLYVDEEALHKPTRGFFRLRGIERPYAGNGLILGTRGSAEAAATLALPDVARVVTFLTRAQADSWAKATASEPEITVTGDDGVTTVVAYRRQVWGDMPKPADTDETE